MGATSPVMGCRSSKWTPAAVKAPAPVRRAVPAAALPAARINSLLFSLIYVVV